MLRHEERSQKKDLRGEKKELERETNLTQNKQKDRNNGDQQKSAKKVNRKTIEKIN